MRDSRTPPGAAGLLQQTVRFPQGSAPNLLPRVRRRQMPTSAAADTLATGAAQPEDDDDPTDLRPMGGRDPLLDRLAGSGSHPLRLEQPAFGPGSVIGNYRVLEPLANGGMGVVFLGEHVHLRRKVALKFLHARLLSDEWAVYRFFSEAVAASRVPHPGVVTVFDYGSFEGGAYLVMEYLPGETLRTRLDRERRLPIPRILDIGVQISMTLAAAHKCGVIHRDLKPDNIYLVPDASGSAYEYVKVLDFGVAKMTSENAAPTTQRGDLLGTPLYMAPEQSVHAGTVDHRCDIYSLGCILYQLITGLAPFRGSMFEILIAHQNEPPPSPRSYDPTIPQVLDSLVLRMMAKSPDARPDSMADVVQALAGVGRERSPEPEARTPLRTHAAWLGLGLGVGLTVAGLGHLATLW